MKVVLQVHVGGIEAGGRCEMRDFRYMRGGKAGMGWDGRLRWVSCRGLEMTVGFGYGNWERERERTMVGLCDIIIAYLGRFSTEYVLFYSSIVIDCSCVVRLPLLQSVT